jgi:hypothetical protein
MKRRLSVLLLLFSILALAAGCAGPTIDEPPPPTPEPTSPPPPTETPQPAAPSAYDVAQQYAGSWSGTWANQTYGTTGAAEMTVVVNEDGTFEITIDLGGMVFGVVDPPPLTYSGSYSAGVGASFGGQGDPTLGDVTFSMTPGGQVTGRLEGILGGSGLAEVTGTATPEMIHLEYSIPIFSANGILTLDHQ